MFRAFLLVAALAVSAQAEDPTSGEPAEKPAPKSGMVHMLGFVRSAAEKSGAQGSDKITTEADKAQQEISALPPDQQAVEAPKVIERHVTALNAAADAVDASVNPEGVRRINDAMASFNNAAGRPDDALRYSQHALDIDPRDRQALINHSAANLSLDHAEAAYADADRAAKLAPDDPDALRARALAAYQKRDYNQAREDAQRALALAPNDPTAFAIMQLANAKVPALKLDKLQAPLAAEVQGEYHGMVQQLNQVAEKRREPESRIALEPQPKPTADLVRAASTKITLKDYFGAISDADRAIQADPDNPQAYFYRAAADNLVGRYGDAATDATRALMIDPHDARARDTRAWAYNNLGRYRDAIADSYHSLEIEPRNAYAFWNLGFAHEHMGDLGTMLSDYKSAASINPQFEPAYRDAASRHGLEPEPQVGSERFRRNDPAEPGRQRRRSFAVVVVSSLIGGILIGLGFIHLYGDAKSAAAKPGKTEAPIPTPLPSLGEGYAMRGQIGMGGMGVVYEAFDKALERTVAVKVMRPELSADPDSRKRFLQEARTVAALHHPAIVDIHGVVENEAGLCLVFERLEGRTVEEILRERGRLSLSQARTLLKPVCQGLEFAHRHGVVHRDLKPGNIMVTSTGQVKLMDFGISRSERTTAGLSAAELATAKGTPYYMAPEQENGEVRRESDVYSLGACLYEMVTGRRPFDSVYSLDAKLERRYPRPSALCPWLPTELDTLVNYALAPEPQDRIRTPGHFWALLERLRDSDQVGAGAA